jgi:hypothetical protein
VRGELYIGLRLITLRMPGKPSQSLAGRKLRFQRLVGQPAQVQRRGPARGVTEQQADASVAKVHGALDGDAGDEGNLVRLQVTGVQGHIRRIDQPDPAPD